MGKYTTGSNISHRGSDDRCELLLDGKKVGIVSITTRSAETMDISIYFNSTGGADSFNASYTTTYLKSGRTTSSGRVYKSGGSLIATIQSSDRSMQGWAITSILEYISF